MFALGTYIKNAPDDGHNDHSTSIELKVVMTLLQLVNDGSPIVRQVSSIVQVMHSYCLASIPELDIRNVVSIWIHSAEEQAWYTCT